jgi:hypothetical protein
MASHSRQYANRETAGFDSSATSGNQRAKTGDTTATNGQAYAASTWNLSQKMAQNSIDRLTLIWLPIMRVGCALDEGKHSWKGHFHASACEC